MTVISAVLSSGCIAVASDSLITGKGVQPAYCSKIVPVATLRAAVSFWGLAQYGGWCTYDWLKEQARKANRFRTLGEFAISLQGDLDLRLGTVPVDSAGIGIHIVGYERINDYWIPELFLLSNYKDPSYTSLCCLHLTRETYAHVSEIGSAAEPRCPEHREFRYRLKVRAFLQQGNLLFYNNGDPALFNPAAKAIFDQVAIGRQRGLLKQVEDFETYREIAKLPIKIVAEVQGGFFLKGTQVVGGQVHDIVITPDGQFSSRSGDDRL